MDFAFGDKKALIFFEKSKQNFQGMLTGLRLDRGDISDRSENSAGRLGRLKQTHSYYRCAHHYTRRYILPVPSVPWALGFDLAGRLGRLKPSRLESGGQFPPWDAWDGVKKLFLY